MAWPTFPDLKGKVAVVTGASAGIGAATCRGLAANGARIVLCARNADGVDRTVRDLQATGAEAVGIAADAAVTADVQRLHDAALDAFGRVDILMPFAGGFSSYTPVEEIDEEEWRHVIDLNLTSSFLALQTFLPGMLERRSGSVVTMTSNSARNIDVTLTASYAASKAGVIQLTRHTAKELAGRNIRVNCLAPGTTSTERVERIMSDEVRARIMALTPLGRLGTSEESANAALFLASDAAAYITGVTLDVAGGRVME